MPITERTGFGARLDRNSIAYVAAGTEGLLILNRTDPTQSVLLSTFDTPGFAATVWGPDGLAYVADGDAGVQIVDVTDPASPLQVTQLPTPNPALGVVSHDDLLYVAAQTELLVVHVSQPNTPTVLASYTPPGTVGSLELVGSRL